PSQQKTTIAFPPIATLHRTDAVQVAYYFSCFEIIGNLLRNDIRSFLTLQALYTFWLFLLTSKYLKRSCEAPGIRFSLAKSKKSIAFLRRTAASPPSVFASLRSNSGFCRNGIRLENTQTY